MSRQSLDGSQHRQSQTYDSPRRTRGAELSLRSYTPSEVQVLKDIITAAYNEDDGTSFLAVFKAYDAVLKSRNIDPARDKIYFKFLLKLARVDGTTWMDKFDHLLRDLQSEQLHSAPPQSRSIRTLAEQHKSHPSRASSDIGVSRNSVRSTVVERPHSVLQIRSPNMSPSPLLSIRSPVDYDFSISFDDGPRNYTILRQFWHAWRAKAIRQRVRVTAQADVADKYYRRVLLPLIFQTWKHKWRYFAILERRVDRDRKRSVYSRCFDWWKYRTKFAQQENGRIHDELVVRRMFKVWLGEVHRKQEQMNSVTLCNVLEKWKAKASTNKDLQVLADNWSQRRILRQYWKEWFFRTCGAKTIQYYQIKLKQRALARWAFKIRRSREMMRHANWFSRRKLMSFFINWHDRTKAAISCEEKADLHRNQQLMASSIKLWQRNQQLSLRMALFRDQIDNKLIKYAWKRWRLTTKVTVDASTQADWRLLKSSFKGWRDDAMATRLERCIDQKRLQESFTYWMVQQRGSLLSRVRNQRLLQEALDIWKEHYDGIQTVLNDTFEIADSGRNLRILGVTFSTWRGSLAIRKEQSSLASVILPYGLALTEQISRRNALLGKSFKLWALMLESHRRLAKEADHARYYFHARRSLMRWHTKLGEIRKRKRQDALNDYLHAKRRLSLTKFFLQWRDRATTCLEFQRTGEEILKKKERILLEDVMLHWRGGLNSVLKNEVLAKSHHRAQLLRGYYRRWRTISSRLNDLSDIAEDYSFSRYELKAAQCLRMWRMRIFQLRGPAMQADLFAERSKRLKLRLMFRIWREKLKSDEVPDEELSVSFRQVQSDRAHTAPLTPKRSTRRDLWRNLRSR